MSEEACGKRAGRSDHSELLTAPVTKVGAWGKVGNGVMLGSDAKVGAASMIGDGATIAEAQVIAQGSRISAPM
jgi:UDP-3-O-[3-hydroxymyristoyl] glucosamine N-acyltransferase